MQATESRHNQNQLGLVPPTVRGVALQLEVEKVIGRASNPPLEQDIVFISAELLEWARPSKARIARLEEENRRLRDAISSLKEQVDSQHADTIRSVTSAFESQHHDLIYPPTVRTNANADHGVVCSHTDIYGFRNKQWTTTFDTVGQSHGPTSAVADEITSNRAMRKRGEPEPQEEHDAIRNQLVADAARLRQLEKFNSSTNIYDFDGVNPELAMHLLSLYWDRQLDVGAVVYRPVFMKDMACSGPHFSKLLLNAIYFTASKYSPRLEVRDDRSDPLSVGRMFRRRITQLLSDHVTRSEITTIQALLLIASSLFSWCDEKSLAWLYSGMAINMITDLGIQMDNRIYRKGHGLSPEQAEVRRRVFWGAYVLDKCQSLYQGRPIRLREADSAIPLSFLDEYEEYDLFEPASYGTSIESSPALSQLVSILKRYCSLSSIMSRILDTLYTERSTSRDPVVLFECSTSLNHKLQSWYEELTSGLTAAMTGSSTATASPHILALTALYHTLKILLHRPFVSDGHLRSASPSVAGIAFEACATAANAIHDTLGIYGKSYSMQLAPYSISYATYVSATIHARIAAHSPAGSHAHDCLQNCLSILTEHQRLYLGPKRALGVILNLTKVMNIDIGDSTVTASSPDEAIAQVTSQEDGVRDPGHLASHHAGLFHTQNLPSDLGHDLQYDLPTYDIDAIIQSFDVSQPVNLRRFESEPAQNDHYRHTPTTDYLDFSLPLDPLFGLDNIDVVV
ncbi:fungal-specific transcription factor domain-containing protein [Aspergillus flavus]|uniref:Fungal-specific transcription factor domain-containing protein n=1 Tax=Aspergillus flavus (strain ATCC 200026 / FGSC A1120 / IAM 13836 / NRRL 3357 / JCM 12722 / SRRC 167) TaxID=332952 RepID=A0A7U2QR63_ASPFN|nr:fungal-specific transcription factor domain-containing protein [Aspergillus flavus]